ncbi:DUF2171 domain-containing protein [Isosphaeraceae bacterium EP7]
MTTSMQEIGRIAVHMEVITSCGQLIGKVDHITGSHIRLTKIDSIDGRLHEIPISLVQSVDSKIHLSKGAAEVMGLWSTTPC